jgi:2-amino-4-hydroxy-6-hydroxymethyldihydropteridine diphosphokinase
LLAVRGLLDAGLRLLRLSRIYETAPVGIIDQPNFLNMVAELDGNSLPPADQLLARLLRIEYSLGRRREFQLGPRTIDLDLLLYKNEISATEFLKLPHPRLHLRRFVLVPLNEMCPKLVHPTLNLTIGELLEKTDDNSDVSIWNPLPKTFKADPQISTDYTN